ncbi:MAG TPA: hypothetical protein VJ323_06030, partial [Bryobacteraceae bacterium]|nr:hypothetical protein [Bryobacteraceae bacterium]
MAFSYNAEIRSSGRCISGAMGKQEQAVVAAFEDTILTVPTVATHRISDRGAQIRRLTTLYGLVAALSRASDMEDVYEAAVASL